MKFLINSEDLIKGITNIQRIVKNPEFATLCLYKHNVYLQASQGGISIRILMDAEVIDASGNTKCGFNCKSVQKLFKGYESITMELLSNEIKFSAKNKARKFNGKFVVVPPEEFSLNEETSVNEINLPETAQTILNKYLSSISISNPWNEEPIPVCIECSNSGFKFCMYDQFHIAYAHDVTCKSKKTVSINIPLEVLDQIHQVLEGESYKLSMGAGYIHVNSVKFEMSVPRIQVSVSNTLEIGESAIIAQSSIKGDSFLMKRTDIMDILSSLDALSDGNIPIVLSPKVNKKDKKDKPGIVIGLSSSFGKANHIINIDKKWSDTYKVNPILFEQCCMISPSEDLFLTFKDKICKIDAEIEGIKFIYICQLM